MATKKETVRQYREMWGRQMTETGLGSWLVVDFDTVGVKPSGSATEVFIRHLFKPEV
jgi:hypothetical protein